MKKKIMPTTYFIIFLALSILFHFIFPIVFVILMEVLFINFEEKKMKKTFGKKYINYTNKVRKWI